MSTAVADRRIGAILVQLVGAALCFGLHRYLDLARRGADFSSRKSWIETPLSRHDHAGRQAGQLTQDDHAGMVLLLSVVQRRELDPVEAALAGIPCALPFARCRQTAEGGAAGRS